MGSNRENRLDYRHLKTVDRVPLLTSRGPVVSALPEIRFLSAVGDAKVLILTIRAQWNDCRHSHFQAKAQASCPRAANSRVRV
jgi:hypothetical protein